MVIYSVLLIFGVIRVLRKVFLEIILGVLKYIVNDYILLYKKCIFY